MPDLGTINFLWPPMLWLLTAVPVVAALYFWMIARRRRHARRYASLALTGNAGGPLRRGLPAVALLLGLTAMIFAVARPQSVIMLPSRISTVILAMDVSGSMRATDVEPNRLAAAQKAAKEFVADQPGKVRIGVVAVAGTAALVQSPTDNREDIVQAIDRFQLQRGTALGSGLLIALVTLLPHAGIDAEQIISGLNSRPPGPEPVRKPESGAPKSVPPGSDSTVAIVLLSDGQSNTGPDPVKMAELAAERGVRVFTLGVGTPEGAILTAKGWSMRVRLDEETLKKIAATTGGEYFRAASAADLKKIYKTLGATLILEKQQMTEVTALFAALGAALAFVGALLSLLWFNRIL